ncbi:MAG: hypothetical protein PWQ16_131 [bacterium]|nr:hypothetical protein [bacterium]
MRSLFRLWLARYPFKLVLVIENLHACVIMKSETVLILHQRGGMKYGVG